MFYSIARDVGNRLADIIDDMLLGDFELVHDESVVYADVDYERLGRERPILRISIDRRPCNAPTEPSYRRERSQQPPAHV